jgi:hypothetical protein
VLTNYFMYLNCGLMVKNLLLKHKGEKFKLLHLYSKLVGYLA